MIASQLGKVTGVAVQGTTPVEQLTSLAEQIGTVHVPTLLVATGTLVLLFALHAWFPRGPDP